MGSAKDYWFQIQEEERDRWIREHLDDEEADEETEGWDKLAHKYAMMLEAQKLEAEYQWFEEQSYSEIHETFIGEIEVLRELVTTQVAIHHEQTFYKMIYVHSVTLLESFLGDTVKSLVVNNKKYFENAIRNVNDLKNLKFSLTEILAQTDGVEGLVLKCLSDILYHNIKKASAILDAVLGHKLSLKMDKAVHITEIRHDIVHRNGKTIEDKLIHIDVDTVKQAIDDIEEFAESLQLKLNELKNA